MTEVRFYHLQTQTLEQALPAILAKALSGGKRVSVRFGKKDDVDTFDDLLWTYNPDSFLPHGSDPAQAAAQPVFLTSGEDNLNGADMLALCNIEAAPQNLDGYALCCDFIDGRDDDAVEHGRQRWRDYKTAGHTVIYYQQNDAGGWDKKA